MDTPQAEYASPLAARQVTAADVESLVQKTKDARKRMSEAVTSTVDKEAATGDETDLKKALLKCLGELQMAAKQKFARKDPAQLGKYLIGKRLDPNRALLEQNARNLLDSAEADDLPGITAAKLTAGEQALKAYKDINVTQGSAQSTATGKRTALNTLKQEITDARITIQLAADAEWPPDDAANAAIRREFQLPAKLRFKG